MLVRDVIVHQTLVSIRLIRSRYHRPIDSTRSILSNSSDERSRGDFFMTDRTRSLGDIAAKPMYRTIDGVSIRFVESDKRDADALLLSPWPESVLCYEPIWSRLAATTHLVAIDLPGFGRS